MAESEAEGRAKAAERERELAYLHTPEAQALLDIPPFLQRPKAESKKW